MPGKYSAAATSSGSSSSASHRRRSHVPRPTGFITRDPSVGSTNPLRRRLPRGPRHRDVVCHTRTLAAPGAEIRDMPSACATLELPRRCHRDLPDGEHNEPRATALAVDSGLWVLELGTTALGIRAIRPLAATSHEAPAGWLTSLGPAALLRVVDDLAAGTRLASTSKKRGPGGAPDTRRPRRRTADPLGMKLDVAWLPGGGRLWCPARQLSRARSVPLRRIDLRGRAGRDTLRESTGGQGREGLRHHPRRGPASQADGIVHARMR